MLIQMMESVLSVKLVFIKMNCISSFMIESFNAYQRLRVAFVLTRMSDFGLLDKLHLLDYEKEMIDR